ncbi:MAG: IS3 family transposase, partial [Clostridium sp.]
PRSIFTECGFKVNILGMERISSAAKRWRRAYKDNGVIGLVDARKSNSGRPNEKDLSIDAKYERLQAQNNLLKAENELLKKIQFLERGLVRKK